MNNQAPGKIHVVFVVIGVENLSVQALSANLKRNGHQTHTVFDPTLFDDKNFLTYPRIGRLFSQEKRVIHEILSLQPDLVAFSVMTPTFQWANKVSNKLKEALPHVPIIFGGIHPTLVPEKCLTNSYADIVCVGEGDDAIVELADSLGQGGERVDIAGLWFKRGDTIIRNPERPIRTDLDSFPEFDKESFDPYRAPNNNMLIVFSRGCPFNCSFCSLYKYAESADAQNVPRVRLRSPQVAIEELKKLKKKYSPTWIEFKDNTFTANKKWIKEFLPLLKKEINLPYKCFVHPSTLTEEVVSLLRDSGCWGVQIGIESISEYVRNHIINRQEKDETIQRAFRLLDEADLPYSLDYILGLPKETEEDLLLAAKIFIELKSCFRISPFLLAYLPKHPLTEIAYNLGILSKEDIDKLENGGHDHYLGFGSMSTRAEFRRLLGYKHFFRLIPHLPKPIARLLLKTRLFKLFGYIPFFGEFVVAVDALSALLINEPDIRSYIKHYLWTIPRVIAHKYFPHRSLWPPSQKPSCRGVQTYEGEKLVA